VRRESTDLEDMFIAHIGAMDTFARGLRAAAKLRVSRLRRAGGCVQPSIRPPPPSLVQADGVWAKWVAQRYATFDSGIGKKIEARGGGGGGGGFRGLACCCVRRRENPHILLIAAPPSLPRLHDVSRVVVVVCAQDGRTSYTELERYVLDNGEAKRTSGKQEKFEALFNDYV
jgi:hypothetical protein